MTGQLCARLMASLLARCVDSSRPILILSLTPVESNRLRRPLVLCRRRCMRCGDATTWRPMRSRHATLGLIVRSTGFDSTSKCKYFQK
jgi:hypothetical protein